MKKYISYPDGGQTERCAIFEKLLGRKRQGYDYDIIDGMINKRLVVYMKEAKIEKRKNTENAIVFGYRNTSLLFGRRIELVSAEEERKNIESELRENNIRVLKFL